MAESSLWMRSTELSLHVSPRFLGAARRAIDLHLASLIMKFHPTLNGVPVACPKYKVLSHAAIINTDFPLMHFNVKADFIVFAPKVGAQLSGKINQVSCDHVGLLVHGCFNASIPSAQLKPSYYFDENDSVWCDDKGRQVLVTEALIVFTVTGIEHVDDIYCIQGSILSEDTGVIEAEELLGDDDLMVGSQRPDVPVTLDAAARRRQRRNERSGKKNRVAEPEVVVVDQPAEEAEEEFEAKRPKKEKKKRSDTQ